MDFSSNNQFAIILIGLPGTGKSFISRKLQQYLNFYSIQTKAFNVGEYRRNILGSNIPVDFFDPLNEEYFEKRWTIAQKALQDMIDYITSKGEIGILDTTITTIASYREKIANTLTANKIKFAYVEIICEDNSVIEKNIREVKILSKDYVDWDVDEVVDDFKKRIENHIPHYDKLSDADDVPFIQVYNNGKLSIFGEHIILNKIKGYLETKIVYFLMNIQTLPKKIYLMEPGQSTSTMKEDTDLSSEGESYAKHLTAKLLSISDHAARNRSLSVFCAPRAYSLETVKYFPEVFKVIEKTELIEMHPGEYSGMSLEQVEALYPEQYKQYNNDRFHYRFPRAEVIYSYIVLL